MAISDGSEEPSEEHPCLSAEDATTAIWHTLGQAHPRHGKKGLNSTEQKHFLGEEKFCGSLSSWKRENKVAFLLSV